MIEVFSPSLHMERGRRDFNIEIDGGVRKKIK